MIKPKNVQYHECPKCGEHKVEHHGKKWALSVFGVAGLFASVFTMGFLFPVFIPVLILIALFKKDNYRCRNCQALYSGEEFRAHLKNYV